MCGDSRVCAKQQEMGLVHVAFNSAKKAVTAYQLWSVARTLISSILLPKNRLSVLMMHDSSLHGVPRYA